MKELKTQLYPAHQKLGGKLSPFAGFLLPLWYKSAREEHEAVRNNVGIFDISHMGLLRFKGEGRQEAIQKMSCNSVKKSKNGKMTYSMVLNEEGGILDDIMFASLENEIIMVVNASNKEKIINWFNTKIKTENVTLEELNQSHSFLAIQGPNACNKIEEILNLSLKNKEKFLLWEDKIQEIPIICSKTGYTGEDGLELMIPHTAVEKIWNMCIEGGITPCGLAARDSLRIEAGLPLYGHELSENITPLETRYKWAISWDENFIGKEALLKQKENIQRKTVGLKLVEKSIPRQGFEIKEGGYITSGALSYKENTPIAMALINNELENKELTVMIRGKEVKATTCSIPFI